MGNVEREVEKSPTPLESTAFFAKPEETARHRRQWRKISDITSPTLNTMSPIPFSEGNENGITVDSYFQMNEASAKKTTKGKQRLHGDEQNENFQISNLAKDSFASG